MFGNKKAVFGLAFFVIIFALLFPSKLMPDNDVEKEKSEKQKKIDRLFKMSLEELMDVRITTAGKTSQRIGDIPASVVLITREDIETYGYRTLGEILENVPGLYGIDDYAEYGANFGVRGFWSGVPNDNMIILVNDVHQVNDLLSNYPLNKVLVPVEAIDRIEIIRGPMSVIYGAGAFFGVINIITNDDSNKPVSMVSASYGSQDTRKLFLRYAGGEGDFQYFFNASFYRTDGLDVAVSDMTVDPSSLEELGLPLDSRTGGRLGDTQKYFNFSGKFKGFYVNMSYNESNKYFYFALPPVADGSLDRINATHISFGYRGNVSKGFDINGRFSYARIRDSYRYDHLFPDFYGVQQVGTDAMEIELNTFYSAASTLNITSGLYYRAILEATNLFDLPSFGNPFFENTRIFLSDDDDIVTQAFFTQVDYSPLKNLKLVAGIRFEQSPKYQLEKFQAIGSEIVIRANETFDQSKIEVIPRFAAILSINESNILKFLYGHAINRPSFAQNYQNTLLAGRDDLSPESIQTLELNYIGTFSNRFSINASVFRNTMDNLITRVVKFTDGQNYDSWSANAGETVTHGIELAFNAEPIEYLRMEFSGTYQKTEDKRREPTNYENIEVAYSPKFLGYFKASYLGVGYKVAVTGNYVGAMEAFWDETLPPDGKRIGERVKGYFLMGANVRFDDLFLDGLFLNIRCSNLFDTEIYYPTFTHNDWATRGTIGAGRSFLVSLGYKF